MRDVVRDVSAPVMRAEPRAFDSETVVVFVDGKTRDGTTPSAAKAVLTNSTINQDNGLNSLIIIFNYTTNRRHKKENMQ